MCFFMTVSLRSRVSFLLSNRSGALSLLRFVSRAFSSMELWRFRQSLSKNINKKLMCLCSERLISDIIQDNSDARKYR
jgi:hypothetical protein